MTETPQQYTARIMSNIGAQEPMKVLAATPKKIERLFQDATPAKLKKRPAPGKWSPAEIVAHLADAEIVIGWRVRAILGAPGTPIQAFDQDAWAEAGPLLPTQSATEPGATPRAARSQSHALQVTHAGTVETLRHALGTRARKCRAHCAHDGWARPESSAPD